MTVREVHADGWLCYVGPRTEIANLLKEHAQQCRKSRDPFTGVAMKDASARISSGRASAFQMVARYMVEEAAPTAGHRNNAAGAGLA